jgi:hypothetical protein
MIAKNQLWPPPRLQRYLEVTYRHYYYTAGVILYCVVMYAVALFMCSKAKNAFAVPMFCTALLPHCTHAAQYTLAVAVKASSCIVRMYVITTLQLLSY